jgi:hypothetical protein
LAVSAAAANADAELPQAKASAHRNAILNFMKFLLGLILFEQPDAMRIYSGAFEAETQPSPRPAATAARSG